MMFKDDYQRLMNAVSPAASLGQRTEKEIIEMMMPKTRKNLLRTVLIAAVIMILTIGAALAAVTASGILSRLFPGGEPSPQALQALVDGSQQVTSQGVTLKVDEYLFDQNSLHFAWTVSSQREDDIFYTTSYHTAYESAADEAIAEESAGAFYGGYGSDETGDNALVHLSQKAPFYSGYAGHAYEKALQGSVNTRLTLHVYQSDYRIEQIESAFPLLNADPGDPDGRAVNCGLEEAGKLGVCRQITAINGYDCFQEALEELLAEGMEWDAAHEAALVRSGVFKEIAVLELDLDASSESAPKPRFELEKARRFDLSDASVILKTLTIDTATTLVEYEVITGKAFDEGNVVGNNVTYVLFDQEGNPLNSDYSMGMSADRLDDREGKHVWHVSLYGNPIPESVSAITFVPTLGLERQRESSNQYFLRMREAAQPSQCFTIEIK